MCSHEPARGIYIHTCIITRQHLAPNVGLEAFDGKKAREPLMAKKWLTQQQSGRQFIPTGPLVSAQHRPLKQSRSRWQPATPGLVNSAHVEPAQLYPAFNSALLEPAQLYPAFNSALLEPAQLYPAFNSALLEPAQLYPAFNSALLGPARCSPGANDVQRSIITPSRVLRDTRSRRRRQQRTPVRPAPSSPTVSTHLSLLDLEGRDGSWSTGAPSWSSLRCHLVVVAAILKLTPSEWSPLYWLMTALCCDGWTSTVLQVSFIMLHSIHWQFSEVSSVNSKSFDYD